MLSLIEFLIGFAVVLGTLADVFVSILMPGVTAGKLSVGSKIQSIAVPLWRRIARSSRHAGRHRWSNGFAPILLALTFSTWLLLLLLGFGLALHAMAPWFAPPLDQFSQALYVAGSSILTLGVSEVDASGAARWLILLGALSGFSVITASVTFILQVQTALQLRELLVMTLPTLASRPVTGIGILESFAQLGMRDDLPRFFREWHDWSGAILHSHVAHPVLCYFHSVDGESDWLSSFESVLDASALVMALTDEAPGTAVLMHRAGSRTAARLCRLFDLKDEQPASIDDRTVEALRKRLDVAGYPTSDSMAGLTSLTKLRADYVGRIEALASHLGATPANLDSTSNRLVRGS